MARLGEEAQAFGLELSEAQVAALARFEQMLLDWNTRMNLTSITEPREIEVKHFLDSLSVALAFESVDRAAARTLIDIGAGAGFPGIPLAIAFPQWSVLLLEATGKKVNFLDHVIHALSLGNVHALHARAEEAAHLREHRARYDVAVARAVAPMPALVEYALPFLRLGGCMVAQKGVDGERELAAAEKAIRLLGGCLGRVIPVYLPGLEPRHLIVIEKREATPASYPRRVGLPEKKPL